MLKDKLNNAIYSKMAENGRNCNLIVIHPQTWQDLLKEVVGSCGMEIYTYDPSLKYMGIRVLRSLDMVDGLFEVY